MTPKTGAERQAAHRSRGRTFTVTLLDKGAIAALDRLVAKHGGVTAAILAALKSAPGATSHDPRHRTPRTD